jgi:hypothetical protein
MFDGLLLVASLARIREALAGHEVKVPVPPTAA